MPCLLCKPVGHEVVWEIKIISLYHKKGQSNLFHERPGSRRAGNYAAFVELSFTVHVSGKEVLKFFHVTYWLHAVGTIVNGVNLTVIGVIDTGW